MEAGHTYKTSISVYALDAFHWWQYGRKVELVASTQEERMRRWYVNIDELGHTRIGEDAYPETVAGVGDV
jgi:hypothetical protein